MKTQQIIDDWNSGLIHKPCFLIYLDLRDFSIFNRLFGHNQADLLLNYVEDTLRSKVRYDSHVYRWGGDEFLIFGPGSLSSAISMINRFREALPVSFHVQVCSLDETSEIKTEMDLIDRRMEAKKWARD